MTYASTILADNPVHWWRFNEQPGAIAACDSGSSRSQLYVMAAQPNVGAPVINPAIPVNSLAFGYEGVASDGGAVAVNGWGFTANDPGTAGGHNPNYAFPSPGTLEYWSYQDASIWAHNLGWQATGVAGSSGAWGFQRLGFSVDIFDFGLASPTPHSLTSDATWHYLAMTWSGTALAWYVDGGVVQTLTMSAGPGSSTAVSFGVGGFGGNVGSQSLGGMFSELAIYSSALSSGQISAHFTAADRRGHVPQYKGIQQVDFNPPVTGVSVDATHAGLTDTGEIILGSFYAVSTLLTIVPPSYGSTVDTPTFYFDLGWLSVITASGVSQTYRIDRVGQFFILPPLTTAVSWKLAPGVVMTLSEMSALF